MLLDIHTIMSLERIDEFSFRISTPVMQYEFTLWGAEAGARRKLLDASFLPYQPETEEFTLDSLDEAMLLLEQKKTTISDRTSYQIWRKLSYLREVIPAEASEIIKRFDTEDQWPVHMFLSRVWAVGKQRSVKDMPLPLILLLAHLDKFTGDPRETAQTNALELVAAGQREILVAAGFRKNPRSAVKIIRKLDIRNCKCEALKTIQSIYKDPEAGPIVKLLCHIPHYNTAFVKLLSNEDAKLIAHQVEPRLLIEIASMAHDEANALVSEIRDTVAMARECDLGGDKLRFTNRDQVSRQHDAYVRLVNSYGLPELLAMKFPDPPRPGNEDIMPLTQPQLVAEEGISQGNCVISYIRRIAAGDVYLYR